MTYIAILGRQPAFGIAELERVFGGSSVKPVSHQAARFECQDFDIQKFGSIPKAGKIIIELNRCDWYQISQKLVQHYTKEWSNFDGKITVGISVYNIKAHPRDIQKTGITLKQNLKKHNVSLRLIPNNSTSLNSATSHHNKLGLSPNKVEIFVIRCDDGKIIVAESTGSQNITAYAKRDQQRPKRDAFVGMLPPKLAQIMINLAASSHHSPTPNSQPPTILDPFCGTGVILQEAALLGYSIYGTDLSDKMIDYSQENLEWLKQQKHIDFSYRLSQGDAMTAQWNQPINTVVCETYLGQPFSAPPSPAKLEEVVSNCNHIITEFLKNLGKQIRPKTTICIAVPAWRNRDGRFTHLPLVSTIARYGYKPHESTNISQNDLLYFREDQVVARELLVLTRI